MTQQEQERRFLEEKACAGLDDRTLGIIGEGGVKRMIEKEVSLRLINEAHEKFMRDTVVIIADHVERYQTHPRQRLSEEQKQLKENDNE